MNTNKFKGAESHMPLFFRNQYLAIEEAGVSGESLILMGTILVELSMSQEDNVITIKDSVSGIQILVSLIQEVICQSNSNSSGTDPNL